MITLYFISSTKAPLYLYPQVAHANLQSRLRVPFSSLCVHCLITFVLISLRLDSRAPLHCPLDVNAQAWAMPAQGPVLASATTLRVYRIPGVLGCSSVAPNLVGN